jgi:hypothetical protein
MLRFQCGLVQKFPGGLAAKMKGVSEPSRWSWEGKRRGVDGRSAKFARATLRVNVLIFDKMI